MNDFNIEKAIATFMVGTVLIFSTTANASGDASKPDAADYMTPSTEDIKLFSRPADVPQPVNNKQTAERISLGKHLFFDPRLSGSNSMSCASCHNPSFGWSDAQPTAVGDGMQILERATPTILNTAYQSVQFWDGRAKTLEEQALGPITAPGEMNQPMYELLGELKEIPAYVEMFEKAYPGEGITPETIGKAIASFERTVVANESDFDRWLNGDKNAMSEEALWGFLVFKGKGDCATCHRGHNFSDDNFHNIGLKDVTNPGRFAVEAKDKNKGAFKTPTLRDIARTGPYMHNGAYATLEEVIDHYDVGGFENAGTLSEDLKPSLNLTEKDKKALIAFMKSLTGDPGEVTVPILPAK